MPHLMTQSDEIKAWNAVIARDRACDDDFVFAVTTTGIYCRPSCPARRPSRAHVRFFHDGFAAREAGFRPCLRCQPDAVSREVAAVTLARQTIEEALNSGGRVPGLADLAAQSGYSAAHFQRVFTRAMGLSPARFARGMRMELAQTALADASVTEAIYAAGYGGASAFYAAAGERMGMTPSVWARGGAGEEIRWAQAQTTLGPLLVAATARGVCRVAFGEGEGELRAKFPHATLVSGGAAMADLVAQVVRAVEAPGESVGIALDVRGTAFQEAVWRALRAIPPGETRSYAQLAAAVGKPKAARAAGSANGANPVAVLIPCHRVVRGDGALGGYAWGEVVKRELLNRERVQTKE
jgi:AraC family transcriptional regulator of adaptative response/methylated-DNA-[protein]-cysteine methyltransferase